MPGTDDQRRKRLAIIGVSTFLLVAVVVAVTVGVSLKDYDSSNPKDSNKSHVSSSEKAVKSICQPTDYKKECEQSLNAEAGNTTDPRELIKTAFNIAIRKIEGGLKQSKLLHEIEKDPRAKLALRTCRHLMTLSIEEFKRSLNNFGGFDLTSVDRILMNLKVWLSGAITYQETCLDGFQNTSSEAGQRMKDALRASMHMSSNGLAIITDMARGFSILNITKQGGRRLLGEEEEDGELDLPAWVEEGMNGARRLLANKGNLKADAVVTKDGRGGTFKSIKSALKKVPKNNKKTFIIVIREGVYREHVRVTRQMTNVVFIGEGENKTRITGSRNFVNGVNTYNTATVAIEGDYFTAINMGFENSAGPQKHQAVALRVQGDKAIFFRCKMDGYQDTLYVHALRQFYKECTISGTIDFVFGDALAVFQNCTFVVRKPMDNQQCIVTAQGRKEKHQPSGIIIHGSSIVSDPDYYPVRSTIKSYLARPWKPYSRTVFLETFIDDLIQPTGYLPWEKDVGLSTCFYSEYNNRGPGSDKSKRVKWRGIKNITAQNAAEFTPSGFFKTDDWIKVTRLPYTPGFFSPK